MHEIKTHQSFTRYWALMNELEAKSYLTKLGVPIILIMTVYTVIFAISFLLKAIGSPSTIETIVLTE